MEPGEHGARLMYLRISILFVALTGLACAQTPESPGIQSPGIQSPTVAVIDYYGVGKTSAEKLRKALAVKVGDPLPASKSDVEERMDAISGVASSHLEAVCCEAGKVILYVGLEETGAPHFDIREEPEGEATLPDPAINDYRRYLEALGDAARRGVVAQDQTSGYPLSADPLTREIQTHFPDLAAEYIAQIREVLRSSYDEEQRAAAAFLAGYNPKKEDAVNDLQNTLRDSDPGVRAVATEGLTALLVYARLNPDQQLKIAPTWFIEMLHSLSWSDREHAMKVLDLMTESRDAAVIDSLRDRALPALIEMARWKTPQHALPAFLLSGRIAGLSESQIQDAWAKGDREFVLSTALAKKKSR